MKRVIVVNVDEELFGRIALLARRHNLPLAAIVRAGALYFIHKHAKEHA